MTFIEFTGILFILAFFAGIIGAMTGLGGGILLVPVLVIVFKLDMHVAMGASLVSVIATSSGAGISYIKKNLINIRLAMFLESGAVIGAICGAFLLHIVPINIIAIFFGCVLMFSVVFSLREHNDKQQVKSSHPWAMALHLNKNSDNKSIHDYPISKVPLGLMLMTLAGTLSGLLGIGSGAFKVLALDLAMGIPYKVATSTSNFMLGMTAAASAGIYWASGFINPLIAGPVLLGVVVGALFGSIIFMHLNTKILRILFAFVVFLLALQMIYKGLMMTGTV